MKFSSERFVFYPGYNIFASEIWKEGNLYVMAFYNTDGVLGATSIAKSSDGIVWETAGISLFFGHSNSWDGRFATDSESVFINGAWWILYTGSDGKSYSIGLAKSTSHYPLLIHENEWIWSDVEMVATSNH